MSGASIIDRLGFIAQRVQEIQSAMTSGGNVLDALVGIHSEREALGSVAGAMIGDTIIDRFEEVTASLDDASKDRRLEALFGLLPYVRF